MTGDELRKGSLILASDESIEELTLAEADEGAPAEKARKSLMKAGDGSLVILDTPDIGLLSLVLHGVRGWIDFFSETPRVAAIHGSCR